MHDEPQKIWQESGAGEFRLESVLEKALESVYASILQDKKVPSNFQNWELFSPKPNKFRLQCFLRIEI